MWVKPYSWCPIHLSFNEKNIRKVETSRWKGWRLEFIFWMLWNATEHFLMSLSQIIARQKFTSGMFCRFVDSVVTLKWQPESREENHKVLGAFKRSNETLEMTRCASFNRLFFSFSFFLFVLVCWLQITTSLMQK
jgi:hypothetical protein